MLGELLNPSEPHSFTQKIFTEAYYVTGTAPDAGDMAVNKRDNNPHPHQADILEELRGRDRQEQLDGMLDVVVSAMEKNKAGKRESGHLK